jgi:hypothetical protein
MTPEVAEKLSILTIQLIAQLDQSVAFVRDHCTTDEFDAYRRTVGRLIAEIDLGIAEKIYREHPSLKPEALDGPYKVDPSVFEPRFYETHR